MYPRKGSKDYSKVSLDDFSDDDSDDGRVGYGHNGSGRGGGGRSGGGSGSGSDNDFVQQSLRTQQQLLKKQDEGLDFLSQSAERLGQMSLEISDELGQQNKMLDSMETDLDRASEELDVVTQKTKEFIQQAGGEKNCIIIMVLSIVVLILLFLIIYT